MHQNFRSTIRQTFASWVSLAFPMAIRRLRHDVYVAFPKREDFIMMLASNPETYLIKKSIVSSFKLKQACDSEFHFVLACPWASKHLSLRHREAYIEGRGWGLLHFEHSFMHTNKHSTKILWTSSSYIFKNTTRMNTGINLWVSLTKYLYPSP